MKLPFSDANRHRAIDHAAFSAFDAPAWTKWIQRFLFHDAVEPEIAVFDEHYSHALIDLYKDLTAPSRLKFTDGVAAAYAALPVMRVNSEQIWILLDVIAVVKPVETEGLVRRQLQAGTLKSVTHRGIGLHAVLLGVAGKYTVDAELAALIEATPDDEPDFSWWLVGFRVLSSFDSRRSFAFLERILPRLTTPGWRNSLEEELKSLTRRGKTQSLYHWYVERRKDLAGTPGFETFSRILSERVIPAAKLRRYRDSFAVLTEKTILAERHDVSLVDVLEIALLHDRVPEHELVAALTYIYKAFKARNGTDAWQLVDHDVPPFDRMYTAEQKGGVSIYTPDAKSLQWLSKKDNAVLLDILQQATQEVTVH